MRGTLFLVHWNAAEAEAHASRLRSQGWSVAVEAADGARASPSDVVVIYLSRLPSHGRETAGYLRSVKATRSLPIVFVDGKPEAVERALARVPDAIFTTSAELDDVLARFSRAG